MKIPNVTFDHSADNFLNCIGIEDSNFEYIEAVTIYEMIAPAVLEEQLDIIIPASDKKSGVFERVLTRVTGDADLMYAFLITFDGIFRDVKSRIKFLSDIRNQDQDEDDDKNVTLMRLKAESMEDVIQHMRDIVQAERIVNLRSFMEESKCDFDLYIDYTVNDKSWEELLPNSEKALKKAKKKKSSPGTKTEKKQQLDMSGIDDLIRKVFSKKDEDEEDDL